MPQIAIYIETATPVDHRGLRELLEGAGHRTLEIRDVAVNHDGIIVTNLLLQDHWRRRTGAHECAGQCANEPDPHREWEQLSDEQRAAFSIAFAEFMLAHAIEEFDAAAALRHQGGFKNVRLTPCPTRKTPPGA